MMGWYKSANQTKCNSCMHKNPTGSTLKEFLSYNTDSIYIQGKHNSLAHTFTLYKHVLITNTQLDKTDTTSWGLSS